LLNKILAGLSPPELRDLEPHLVRMDLPRGFVLHGSGSPVAYAFFLEEGLASIVVNLSNGNTVEVGVVGREGMTGLPILLESNSMPQQAFMQIAGSGYRLRAPVLRQALQRYPRLRSLLLGYLHLHLVQASQTAACNRLHEVEERMARWLLICQDRLNGQEIHLTHEFLAQMLGTRRSSVTIAAGVLHRDGLIDYRRGRVQIRDREGLKQASCECYQVVHAEQERLGLL